MKKRIFPLGISILIYGIVTLVVLGLAIFITIRQQEDTQLLRIIIVWVLFAIVLLFTIIPVIVYSIKLRDNTLSMMKDFGLFPEDRVQYKESVNLKEIKEYKVILSEKDSRGEPYKTKAPKRTFISFTMNDEQGTVKRLFVHNLGKKQLVKLLDLIKEISGIEVTTE